MVLMLTGKIGSKYVNHVGNLISLDTLSIQNITKFDVVDVKLIRRDTDNRTYEVV